MRTRDTIMGVLVVIALVLTYAAFCQWFYGDWTCAFSECVRVKVVP